MIIHRWIVVQFVISTQLLLSFHFHIYCNVSYNCILAIHTIQLWLC
jgi:hypothetical protein